MKSLICIIVGITAFMLSCSNNDNEILYNTKVNITDYSLAGSSCTWKNAEKNKLYIIKSEDAFNNYIVCSENDFPAIDFERSSLLLVHGSNLSGIHSIERQLEQLEKNKYNLKISIVSNASAVVQSWNVAILVPRLTDEAEFSMEVTSL